MKAITTRYLNPTNAHGGRIKADDGDGNSITVSYPHDRNQGADAHSVAAVALCRKMGWGGSLISGATKDGYVFVFANSERHEVHLTDAEREAAWKRTTDRIDAILGSHA